MLLFRLFLYFPQPPHSPAPEQKLTFHSSNREIPRVEEDLRVKRLSGNHGGNHPFASYFSSAFVPPPTRENRPRLCLAIILQVTFTVALNSTRDYIRPNDRGGNGSGT